MLFTDFAFHARSPVAHAASPSRMRAWCLVACLFVSCWRAGTAFAQPVPIALGLYVDPAVLSPSVLQTALEAELGLALEALPAPDPSRATLRVEALGSDQVRITLEGGDGRRVERDAPLLDHDAQGVETVTLLASNMLRNEAAGLLRELNPEPRDTEKPPPVRLERDEQKPNEHDPMKAFNACLTPVTMPVGVDFVPGVGMSSSASGRRAVRGVSFGVLGSYSRGVRGFSLAGLVNIQRESMCGVQIGGLANLVLGSSQGLLVAPLNFVMRASGGPKIGVLNVIRGAQRGATLGVVNLVFHDHSGVSAGVVNLNWGAFRGAAGGVLNFAKSDVNGSQIGVGNISGGSVAGAQLGLGNVALGDVHGVQIGLGNIAGKEVRGTQIGLFNYAERNRAPVGLVSIVRGGRTDLDIWGSEHGTIMLGISHGGERVHNLYYVGARTGSAGQRFVAALGIGVRAAEYRRFRLDVDSVSQYIYRDGANKPTFQTGFRAPFTFMLMSGLGLMVAPSYQFFFSEDSGESSQASFGRTVFSGDRTRVEGFPEMSVGLRFELPSGSARAH